MKYHEKRSLACRGAVDQLEDMEVPVFMVGKKSIASWQDGHCSYGHDYVSLFPAFNQEHRKCFLIVEEWDSAPGYSCSGLTDERIVPFEEGIALLCEHGMFPWVSNTEEVKK